MNPDLRTLDFLSISTILDSLDALVYVSDMDTYEMIFMNRYGQEYWGAWKGRRCYEVLQAGQKTPCSFCNNHLLKQSDGRPAEVVVWEFQNTITGRWYQCRDQAIPWVDGRTVRIEIAFDITQRKQMEEELRLARQSAETLAQTDSLTGLRNRRAFFEEAGQVFRQARRFAHPVGVAMLDIDHFKRVNDRHGHFIGDSVLRQVAAVIAGCLRDVDLAGRIGGEEFGLVLPETCFDDALMVCERIRSAVHALDIAAGDDTLLKVSCSIGVAGCHSGQSSVENLLVEADRALYRAKGLGRNRVEHSVSD